MDYIFDYFITSLVKPLLDGRDNVIVTEGILSHNNSPKRYYRVRLDDKRSFYFFDSELDECENKIELKQLTDYIKRTMM